MIDEVLKTAKAITLFVTGRLIPVYCALSMALVYYVFTVKIFQLDDTLSILITAGMGIASFAAMVDTTGYFNGLLFPIRHTVTFFYVYLLRRSDGVYKIGYTRNIFLRIRAHQKDYGQHFKLIKYWSVRNRFRAEFAALQMTSRFHHTEGNRKELRRMNLYQVLVFVIRFSRWLARYE